MVQRVDNDRHGRHRQRIRYQRPIICSIGSLVDVTTTPRTARTHTQVQRVWDRRNNRETSELSVKDSIAASNPGCAAISALIDATAALETTINRYVQRS